jgi:hypothetical protein
VGTYDLLPKFSLTFTMDGDAMYAQSNPNDKMRVYAESEMKVFPKAMNAEIEFVKDNKGQVTGLVLHQGGRDLKGVKK